MRCIYCNTDNDYKTRQAQHGKCSQCQRVFAFEPQTDPLRVTDKLFQQTLQDISGKGKLHFTERQVWYEFNRRMRKWKGWKKPLLVALGATGVAILLGAGTVTGATGLVVFTLIVGVFALVSFGMAVTRFLNQQGNPFAEPTFEIFRSRYLDQWENAHGTIKGLLRHEIRNATDVTAREPDLSAYSFDRVVVTDREDVARLLVANNFHFENNCAILSENYPPGMKDTLLTMLRRNPELQVFALHDASANGCELPVALRKANWFPGATMNVFDTGLRPRQAQALKLPKLDGARRALSNQLRTMLKADEITLLENGSAFELEALRPSKLIRTLYKYFNQARKPGASIAAEAGLGLAPIFFLEFGGEAGGGDADGDAGDGADSFG